MVGKGELTQEQANEKIRWILEKINAKDKSS